jgi:uncharacterized damage-inducible protein DinB
MEVNQLTTSEYLPFYATYIKKAGTKNLLVGLEDNRDSVLSFFESISENKFKYQYAAHKWTIKEILQHLIDAERVFSYRALNFARKDDAALSGYDQNRYTKASFANLRSKSSLIEEYKIVSQATLLMFKSFNDDMLKSIGIASNGEMSVRAIGFIIIGHETHHCDVIKERYL